MSKYRIIERKYLDGGVSYICQKRHLWLRWKVMTYPERGDYIFDAIFGTLEEAKRFLPKEATITEEKVVFEK